MRLTRRDASIGSLWIGPLLAVAAIALTLGAGELAMRIWARFHFPVYDESTIHRRSKDDVLIYEMRPGAQTVFQGVPVRINGDGFRDDPFPTVRPPEAIGIAVIGDSVAWGWGGVQMEDVFPQQLELRLRERGVSNVVYNFGTSGYNTMQEIRLLDLRGWSYSPNVVLISYCLNDPDAFTAGHVRHFKPPKSELLYALDRLRERLAMRSSGLDYHHYLHSAYRRQIQSEFETLGERSRQHDVPIVVAIIPVFESLRGAYPYNDLHRSLARTARAAGLHVLDLAPKFPSAEVAAHRIDLWHPNAAGHARIAEAIASWLIAARCFDPWSCSLTVP